MRSIEAITQREVAEYRRRNPRSEVQHQRALKVIPGGTTRTLMWFPPFPFYAAQGSGSRLTDLDGNERIDFYGNASSLILGYQHPAVARAIAEQAAKGTVFQVPSGPEVELAELLCERVPSVEQVRYTNSGTESTLIAVRAARAFTGRPVLAKFEGGYHGTLDEVSLSIRPDPAQAGDRERPTPVPASRGIPPHVAEGVIILPFNDADGTARILREQGRRVAGVIVEPIQGGAGYIPARPEFLESLRKVTAEIGSVLVFDEVQTLRVAPGGAQAVFGVTPDLTTMGKIIGGGFPVGAIGGRADLMALFDGTKGKPAIPHAGTFNGNPMGMAAGLATMRELTPEVYQRLATMGARLRREIARVCEKHGVPAQVTGDASFFKIHFTAEPIADVRDAQRSDPAMEYAAFLGLLNRGIFPGPGCRGCVSGVMTEADVAGFATALEDVFAS